MKDGFNAGFAARRSQFPTCTEAARRAQIAAAARGQELAVSLSRAKTPVQTPPPEGEVEGVTETPPPR
jgi:sugar/nucleoside kinase (ribokinase family)